MLSDFQDHLKKRFPELLENPLIIACSGGLDSVVLTELCAASKLPFDLAHCHFGLRGEASDQDAAFVRALAMKYNVKIHVKAFETNKYASKNKLTLQEAARALRYGWFDTLLREDPEAYLLTAHQADDQLETFLMHLGRGAGLQGLCGIPERNGRIRRPLLPFCRERLEHYAEAGGIQWREDASNATDAYLRNRLRHHVVPAAKMAIPDLLSAFLTSLEHLRDSRDVLDQYISRLRRELEIPEEAWTRYDVATLKELQPLRPTLFELFRDYGFTDWESLVALLDAPPGKELHSKTHRLLKDREALLLQPIRQQDLRVYSVSLSGNPPDLPLRLQISRVREIGDTGPEILYVDKETLKGQLSLRKWRKGDYFCPIGMRGRKRVSKFFKDLKLNQFQKEAQWILLCGEDIVWIPGLRADNRFKVTPDTREIIRIACTD